MVKEGKKIEKGLQKQIKKDQKKEKKQQQKAYCMFCQGLFHMLEW